MNLLGGVLKLCICCLVVVFFFDMSRKNYRSESGNLSKETFLFMTDNPI